MSRFDASLTAGFLQDLSEFRGGNDVEIVVVGILFKARDVSGSPCC